MMNKGSNMNEKDTRNTKARVQPKYKSYNNEDIHDVAP